MTVKNIILILLFMSIAAALTIINLKQQQIAQDVRVIAQFVAIECKPY